MFALRKQIEDEVVAVLSGEPTLRGLSPQPWDSDKPITDAERIAVQANQPPTINAGVEIYRMTVVVTYYGKSGPSAAGRVLGAIRERLSYSCLAGFINPRGHLHVCGVVPAAGSQNVSGNLRVFTEAIELVCCYA